MILDKEGIRDELPAFLQESIENMERAWEKKKTENFSDWDCYYCDLQSSINIAEVEHLISSELAWFLREKYLYLHKPEDLGENTEYSCLLES